MLAKSILPWLGGSASVWTTCLLFFQAALLLGYCYAHWLRRWLPPGMQTALHVGLLSASLLLLPPVPQRLGWAAAHPVPGILAMLLAVIGLPYLLLSSTSVLVQSWNSKYTAPYPLFALSNSGALLALYVYPLLMEPLLTARHQQWMWAALYIAYAILFGSLAFESGTADAKCESEKIPRLDWQTCALWFALAMCTSTLLLAVTNHLCQDLAAVPLLWVAPLSLYLLSFVVVFQRKGAYRPRLARLALPAALAGMGLGIYFQKTVSLWVSGFLFGMGLFVCCWFCHGELARVAPHPRDLTTFYLLLASGGAAGGL